MIFVIRSFLANISHVKAMDMWLPHQKKPQGKVRIGMVFGEK